VIIGANLAPDLLEQLDRCCLSDAEIDLGPEAWVEYEDPFPAWRVAAGEASDTESSGSTDDAEVDLSAPTASPDCPEESCVPPDLQR